MSIEIGSLILVRNTDSSTIGHGSVREVINSPMFMVDMEDGKTIRYAEQSLCTELNPEEQAAYWKKRFEDLRDNRNS